MSDYILNPHNSGSQIPGPLPDNYYGRGAYPLACEFTKAPNYVIFIKDMNHNFGFFYGSSASFAQLGGVDAATEGANKADTANYEIFPASFGTAGRIIHGHPTAWSGSSGDASGSVRFVYEGGKDGQGRP